MTSKEMIKLLKKNGWVFDRASGSHHIFIKEGERNNVSVPVHSNRDLPKGTREGILKTAGLK